MLLLMLLRSVSLVFVCFSFYVYIFYSSCPTSTDLCVEGTGRAAFSGVTAPPTGFMGENGRDLSGCLSPPSLPPLQSSPPPSRTETQRTPWTQRTPSSAGTVSPAHSTAGQSLYNMFLHISLFFVFDFNLSDSSQTSAPPDLIYSCSSSSADLLLPVSSLLSVSSLLHDGESL